MKSEVLSVVIEWEVRKIPNCAKTSVFQTRAITLVFDFPFIFSVHMKLLCSKQDSRGQCYGYGRWKEFPAEAVWLFAEIPAGRRQRRRETGDPQRARRWLFWIPFLQWEWWVFFSKLSHISSEFEVRPNFLWKTRFIDGWKCIQIVPSYVNRYLRRLLSGLFIIIPLVS